MTSNVAQNYISSSPNQKKHYLETDKDGIPLQKQVPLTYQVYQGPGNESIEPDGSNSFSVGSILVGPLDVDFRTHIQNYARRTINIFVLAGQVQPVNLLFPLAGYFVSQLGTPNVINNYVIAPSINHQAVQVSFGEYGASLHVVG